MVNAKSEYFIAQSIRQYWLLESVAPVSFFIHSLARTFIRCICSPEKTHANKPKNSTDNGWVSVHHGWKRRRRTKKAKIIITIKMVRCIIPPSSLSSSSSSSAASLCVYFGLNVHFTGFYPFLFVTATRFLFQFDVVFLSLFCPVHWQPHSYNKCLCLQNAELHKIMGNLFLMHDGV